MRTSYKTWIFLCLALLFGFVPISRAQSTTWTEQALYTFAENRYAIPQLVQAPDGNFWGVTAAKGTSSDTGFYGAIFKITPDGAYNDVYNFTSANLSPAFGAGLTVGHDGALYGFLSGGSSQLYRITTDGQFSIVYTFAGTAGIQAPPTIDADGNFYGQSFNGGSNGSGFLFSISPTGTFTDLWDCSSDDCGQPSGPLVLASNGKFYGVSVAGGVNAGGSIYSYDPNGGLKVIYSCASNDANNATDCTAPSGGLVELSDGTLWGQAYQGGTNDFGVLFKIIPGASSDTFQYVYSLGDGLYSAGPQYGTIWLGGDGNLYGGATGKFPNATTVYQFVPSSGTFTGLWAATRNSKATNNIIVNPASDFLMSGDGSIWGGGNSGSPNNYGGIFKITPSTPPPPTITLTASAASIDLGKSVTLTYAVNNAYSTTAKQCDAFTNGVSGDVFTGSLGTSGTATITPTKAGMYTFAYTCGGVETATATVNVDNVPLSVSTTTLASAVVGTAYSTTLQATGGVAPYTWSIASGLPLGLSLDTKTGIISGKPTQAGTDNFTVQVSDSESTPATASTTLAITVAYPPVSIATTTLPGGVVGMAYSQTLQASGGSSPYTWAISSGSLPAGLALNASTGVISGTPTAEAASTFTVKVSDSQGSPSTTTASLSITIAPAPITPTITATVNPSSIAPGGNTTLTATVSGASGSTAPTGTVQFQSNGSALGFPVTLANGTATLSNQSFATAGMYSITAVYSGDANYTAATSSAATLTVAALTPTITASPTTVTITSPGGSGSTTLTLTNFSSSSVTVTCSGLPSGAACSAGTVNSSGTATLQITTTGASAALALPHNNTQTMYAFALPGLLALGGLFATRKRQWQRLLMILFLLSAGGALTGCGGSGNHSSGSGGTPAGTSTVTVTATAGSQTATVPITLIVQ